MLAIVEVFSWSISVALVGVYIWGFVRTRNAGFLLLLIGTGLAIVMRLAFPALISLSDNILPDIPLEDRIRLASGIPGLIGGVVILIGALILTTGWPLPTESSPNRAVPEAPQPMNDPA